MRLAYFSDVHSSIHALRSVLEDVEDQEPDLVLCGGDLVGYGAHPNEVIEELRGRGLPTIMGNYDEGVGFDRDDCGCAYRTEQERRWGALSLSWSREMVTVRNKAWLRSLPRSIEKDWEGRHVVMVHGSPRRINEYLYEDRREATLRRLLDMVRADVLICGHTHVPYDRGIDGRSVINGGSVGKPKHGNPMACYVVIDVGADTVQSTFRFVEYDVEAAARAVEESGLPDHYAHLIRTGQR